MEKTTIKLQKLLSGLFLLLVSYGLLFLMPKNANLLSWIILAVSAFIFCIGAYWMGCAFNGPTGDAFVKGKRIFLRTASVALIALCVYLCWKDKLSDRSMIAGTLLLIEGITAWMISDAKTYNKTMDGMKQVPSMAAPLDEVFRAFEQVETPLGLPWMGKVQSIDDPCIIYGPTQAGSFLYCWYHTGEFMVSECDDVSWLNADEAEKHKVTTSWDRDADELGQLYHLTAKLLPDFYWNMFEDYAVDHVAACKFLDGFRSLRPDVYIFNEQFGITEKDYELQDLDGNVRYFLHGSIPFLTFTLSDAETGEEEFKITRRLLHALPHYDVYHRGEKYGSVAKQFDLTHESFKMDTPEGLLELRELTTTVGDQFVVYLNDYLIGTISERMTLTVRDAIYDNFIITAFEPQRVALMATLTVMLQSFKDRDND
ncbi:MAG: hypothetical protein E7422_05765 [Ruminococcaceae bacterium]|jgi:uncharacterized protein YxjI|nr:hypothetical protein [Oscillospiraceae bacterium]